MGATISPKDKTNAGASGTTATMPLAMQLEITRIVHTALAEDLGISPATVAKLAGTQALTDFDATTAATVPPNAKGSGQFVLKQPGTIAGLAIALQVFETVDPSIQFEAAVAEGTSFTEVPQVIAKVKGNARSLLVAERTALNLIQRISGIATATKQYADKAAPHGIQILDTRKTTPGMRMLEKYAVRTGGGTNHRIGLFDAILIKDNHISIAGGVTQAIEKVRTKFPGRPLQVEVTNESQLHEALAMKAEKIMLDNMTPDQIKSAVTLVDDAARGNTRSFIEVSGGVNLSNIDSYLLKGVDAISIGATTHSVRSLDISLEIEG